MRTMKRFYFGLIIVFWLLCCFNITLAQADSTRLWSSQYSASFYGLTRHYFNNHSDINYYQWQHEARANISAKWNYRQYWQAQLALLGNANAIHERRTRFWVNEAYLQYRKKGIFLRAGKQTIKWGTLTGYSALDLANRYDYYDVLDTDDERLGLWGLEARWRKGQTELQLRTFAPDNRSRLHLLDNRWVHLPQFMPVSNGTTAFVPMNFLGGYANYNKQLPTLGLSVASDLGNWQWRGSWFYGNNDIPLNRVALKTISADGVDYGIQLNYRPMMISALHLSTWLGSWNVWAEAAHVNSERYNEGQALSVDNYTFASIGVDRFWQFNQPEQQLKWIAQFIHVFPNSGTTYTPTEIDHVFQSSFLLDANFQLTYKWKFALRTIADVKVNGYYVAPRITFRLSDQYEMQLSADWLKGSDSSFFGYFKDNSRLVFHLRYQPF